MPVDNNKFLPLDYLNQSLLLKLARDSIRCYLATRREASVDATQFPPALLQEAASFISLRHKGKLRGYIGTSNAYRPLVSDVVHNAHSAAFEDPRFPALTRDEEFHLHIEISVLTTPQLIAFAGERDLLEQLRPNVDGLMLQEGVHRATFLPDSWENLADPKAFLNQLKVNAGLSPNHWSDRIEVRRFKTITFAE